MLVAVATQMLMTKSMMKLYGGNSEVVTGQLLMTRQRSVAEHHCQSCSKGSNWKCEKSKVQGGGNVGLENVGIDHRIEKCGNKSSEHLTSC